MSDVSVTLQVPEELLDKVRKVSVAFQSDFETDMVHLMECYVDSYQQLQRDPVAKVVLKG